MTTKSFLKWAGSKRQLLPEIEKRLPTSFNTYYEPFLGGGSLFFRLQPKHSVLSDVNEELINCYDVLSWRINELLEELDDYENTPECYNRIRNMDRSPFYDEIDKITKAARFIFLNRTCFNGLYRVNKHGKFNTPYGKYKRLKPWDNSLLRQASSIVKLATLRCADYKQTVCQSVENDFVYFDPPYLPTSKTSNFTSYTKQSFSIDDHIELQKVFKQLTERNVKVMLSNCDIPFVRDLYKDFNIDVVKAKRTINSDVTKRGKVNELIIANYDN